MSDLAEKVKLKWIKEIVTEDERLKRIKAKEIQEANVIAENLGDEKDTIISLV